MEHSTSVAKIGAALAKVAAKIDNPHKNATNPHYKNRYADLAEVINTSRGLLAEHGVSVIQCPGMEDGLVTVESMLLHESGEWIKSVAKSPLPKADPQGVGSATTYLRRYSLAALLGIAQEDDDGENASQTRNQVTGEKHTPLRELAGEEPRGHIPTAERVASGNGGDPLDATVPFGKYKGRVWRSLIETDRNYVGWAVEKMDKLDFTVKDALQAALNPPKATVPLSQPDDDMPF